jgi:integrase
VTHSPVFGLKIVLKEDKKPEILKLDEIRRLLREARERNHPWYPIWAVALLTGMRNGELFALKWSDVDLEKGLITVQRSYNKRTKEFKCTKAGYWRTVPISEELKYLLLDLRHRHHHPDFGDHGGRGGFGGHDGGGGFTGGGGRDSVGLDFVLPRMELWVQGAQARVLREFCSSVGLSQIKFHTLRACFATQLLGHGVEMVKVMKIGGWRDIKTVQVYLRLAGVDERGATDGLRFISRTGDPGRQFVELLKPKK